MTRHISEKDYIYRVAKGIYDELEQYMLAILKDDLSDLYHDAYTEGYEEGYEVGYDKGLKDGKQE